MKTLYALAFASLALSANATTFELTNSGFTFSPSVINMTTSDEIHLVLPNPHTCTQVSQDTWNAGGNTPLSGGFNYASGTHTFSLDVPGTYYFVCSPHASSGMKGMIIVGIGTQVQEVAAPAVALLAPNPASTSVRLPFTSPDMRINMVDVNGRVVMDAANFSNGTVNVSGLNRGTYLVIVKDGTGAMVMRERLVITR